MDFAGWLRGQLKPDGRYGINELGRLVGVNGTTVMAWRDGRAIPEWYRAARLAEITGEAAEVVQRLLLETHSARSERRRQGRGGPAVSASGWMSARRPLGKASHASEVSIPAGASRLRRAAPVHV